MTRLNDGLPNIIMTTTFSTLWQSKFFRFLLVGFVNTAFSYSVYAAMLFIGVNYALSNLIALLTGMLLSFKMQGIFVFRNSNNQCLGRFITCWAGIYVVNILFIRIGIGLGLNAYTSGALALPPVSALAYLIQKLFVFRKIKLGR